MTLDGRETWWKGSIDAVPMEGGVGLLIAVRERPSGRPGGRPPAGGSAPRDEERFRFLAEVMAQIVCVLEPDGAPRYLNSAWIAFSGLDLPATVRSGWAGVLHPDDGGAALRCLERVLASRRSQDVELRYRAAAGGYRWFLSRLALVVEDGRVVQLIGAAMDIEDRLRAEQDLRRRGEDAQRRAAELQAVLTERKRDEEALRRSNEQLRAVQEAARIGFWDWNLVSGELVWSDQGKALFGLPADAIMSHPAFLAATHPDDRSRVHGGSVRAHSEGIGKGAEFVVVLPLSAPPAPPPPSERARPAAAPLDILLIEDNLDAGDTLADILALDGHRVRIARDAAAGLAQARQRKPDVILCDIGLPDTSGYEVAQTIRRDPGLQGLRLVALSGYAQPEDQFRALQAGFDLHLPKPPPLERLLAVLGRGGGGAG